MAKVWKSRWCGKILLKEAPKHYGVNALKLRGDVGIHEGCSMFVDEKATSNWPPSVSDEMLMVESYVSRKHCEFLLREAFKQWNTKLDRTRQS